MPRTPAPGTRERILSAASTLFYDHGVRAVGMNQVVARAGTGKNLLYRHFPTKRALVAAHLGRVRAVREAAAAQALADAGSDPRDRLVALVAEVAGTVARPGFRGCAFRHYLTEFPDDHDLDEGAPAGVARDYLTVTRHRVERLVAETGVTDPAALAEQLWLVVDGLYLQASYRDRADRRAGAEAAVALARGLLARSAPAAVGAQRRRPQAASTRSGTAAGAGA